MPPMPSALSVALRQEKLLSYDPQSYDFAAIICRILQLPPNYDLGSLHTHPQAAAQRDSLMPDWTRRQTDSNS